MKPDSWIAVLYTYGPFAIMVFLVFVTERKIRRALGAAPTEEKRTYTILYVLNWAAIFGLVVFSVYAWKRLNLDRQPTIAGRIENIAPNESVATGSGDLYLRRQYISDARSDYDWLLLCKRAFADGETITFTVSSREKAEVDYELPIRKAFYQSGVVLRRIQDKLFLDYNGTKTELQGVIRPLLANSAEPSKKAWWSFLMPTANAAPQVEKSATLALALESGDANIRRHARAELAKQGQRALPWIEEILTDPRSAYHLRLGAIVALNNMPGLPSEALTPSLKNAVIAASSDKDPTIRTQASELRAKFKLPNTPVVLPVTVFEHADFSGRSQAYDVGKYLANKRQLGLLPNNSASSIRVEKGFRARLCDSEGLGNGGPPCIDYAPGSHSITGIFGDKVSYVEVQRTK